MGNRFRFGSLPPAYSSVPAWIAGAVFLAGICLTQLASDGLFHDLAAFFNIALYCSLFVLTWHSRKLDHDPFFVFLGVCSFTFACTEALYVLAFMGAFSFLGRGSQLPAQIWASTRMLEGMALAAAPLFVQRRFPPLRLLGEGVIALCVVIGITLVWPIFPDIVTIADGPLSPAMVITSAISILCIASLILTLSRRTFFDPTVLVFVVACIALKLAAQLFVFLTLRYGGWWDTAAQLAVMISTFLLYRAVVHDAHMDPSRVVVWESAPAGKGPVRTLIEIREPGRLIPICMVCRKIRTSDGTWTSLERFLAEHEGFELSHGICPECAERTYADAVQGTPG